MDEKNEPIFLEDVTVELVKHSASDADVIWAARVSTSGETSLDEIGKDLSLIHISEPTRPY